MEHHGQSQSQMSAAGGNELGCMGCHGGIANVAQMGESNGARRGNIHGGTFTWGSGAKWPGETAEHFLVGGYLNGWIDNGDATANCQGGDCSHTGGSGQSYSR